MALKQAAGEYVKASAGHEVTKGWIVARGPKVATGHSKMVNLTRTRSTVENPCAGVESVT